MYPVASPVALLACLWFPLQFLTPVLVFVSSPLQQAGPLPLPIFNVPSFSQISSSLTLRLHIHSRPPLLPPFSCISSPFHRFHLSFLFPTYCNPYKSHLFLSKLPLPSYHFSLIHLSSSHHYIFRLSYLFC